LSRCERGVARDEVAVVVGSSGGWGRAIAKALAVQGTAVVVNGRSPSAVADAVDEIRALGGRAEGVAVPAQTMDAAAQIMDMAVSAYGRLDILVNSAGVKRAMALVEITEESFEEAVGVQLAAPFYCSNAAARRMIEQGTGGRIVNLVGGAALRAVPNKSQHAATKGGVLAATLTWAAELAEHGITVNAVRGAVSTPGTRQQIEDARVADARRGAGRARPSDADLGFFPPEDAAALVVWLVSAGAADVTGRYFGIDGPVLSVWDVGNVVLELHHDTVWTAESIDDRVRSALQRLPTGLGSARSWAGGRG
jgi:NAD(P)-dependent dehydrogenase (short-subunit alcohol dehydrogenase family)